MPWVSLLNNPTKKLKSLLVHQKKVTLNYRIGISLQKTLFCPISHEYNIFLGRNPTTMRPF